MSRPAVVPTWRDSRDRTWFDRVMRCALTGATGFVGGALARQLRRRGDEVVALVRDPARSTHLSDLGIQLVNGDLGDLDSLDRLCADADALFHVAGWYKVGQRDPSIGTRATISNPSLRSRHQPKPTRRPVLDTGLGFFFAAQR